MDRRSERERRRPRLLFAGLVAGLFALAAAPALAAGCYDTAQTEADLLACAAANLKSADAQLATLYRQAAGRLAGDPRAAAALAEAQRDWLDFRDAQCRFETWRTVGHGVQPMLENECRARLARTRAQALHGALTCAADATSPEDAAECTLPAAPAAPSAPALAQ